MNCQPRGTWRESCEVSCDCEAPGWGANRCALAIFASETELAPHGAQCDRLCPSPSPSPWKEPFRGGLREGSARATETLSGGSAISHCGQGTWNEADSFAAARPHADEEMMAEEETRHRAGERQREKATVVEMQRAQHCVEMPACQSLLLAGRSCA